MMRVLRVKGLWQRVIRNVGETSSGVNQVIINLDLNPGREKTYNVTSVEKRGTRSRIVQRKRKEAQYQKIKRVHQSLRI